MNALWLMGLLGLSASLSAAPSTPQRSAIRTTVSGLPLTFEVNRGQSDDRVDFLARGQGYTLFLTPTEAVFALVPPKVSSKRSGNGRESPQPERTVMRMQLIDSAPDPRVQGLDGLPGKVNYFRGNDSSKWRANVPTFKRVWYTSVYPGVDLIYYGQSQQLEYDFIVSPGADPSTIKLAFAGVDDATVDARGDLVLNTAGGPLRFHRPLVYQVQEGRRHTVDGSYVQMSSHKIGFRVGVYDRTRPLIIDPVLSYSTYLGGSGHDRPTSIAVDATGSAYVTGTTSSTDFPTMNALQPMLALPFADAFLAKLTPDGTALIYATYLGGSGEDRAFSIAVDSMGAAYMTGDTSSADFPTVLGLQATLKGGLDSFIAKISADGSQLIYSTYLGGNGTETGTSIALDLTGAAYIGGQTTSSDFPTKNALQPELTGPSEDPFVAKLTPDGTALAYSTYLGGSARDVGVAIAVDSLGAAYVTGSTQSADFPTVNPIQPFTGGEDAFVAKFAPDGRTLTYSTHLGGSNGFDAGLSIAVDMSGAAYVTGLTESSDFPTVNALQPVSRGRNDAFVAKLPPEGGALTYATYLSGSSSDEGTGISVDSAGAAYVTGFTLSHNFPTEPAAVCSPRLGGYDTFVTKIRPDGVALVYSRYLGGSEGDLGLAIAVDLAGAAYVTGETTSMDFPAVQPLQAAYRGNGDAFIAKITEDSLATAPGNDSIDGNRNGGDDGGGSIDALLAVLLAQLALARALRQRSRLRH